MNFILFHVLPCRESFDSYQLFWPNGIIFTVTKLDLPEISPGCSFPSFPLLFTTISGKEVAIQFDQIVGISTFSSHNLSDPRNRDQGVLSTSEHSLVVQGNHKECHAGPHQTHPKQKGALTDQLATKNTMAKLQTKIM